MSEFRSIAQVFTEVDLWDEKIPTTKFGADGLELLSSRIRRAVHAHRLTEENERVDPEAKARRLARVADRERAELAAMKARIESEYLDAMPGALRAMGLKEQEMHAIGGLDMEWPAVVEVKRWMDGKKLFLTMGGPVGSGKTLAAASCLLQQNEWVECESYAGRQWRTRWGRFVKAGELARFSYFDKSDRLFLDRLAAVKFLIIDDLGTEAKIETWLATLTDLIDARARNEKRTIITTNLSSQVLKAAYGERVWRRLEDFGEFVAAKRPVAA